MKGSSKGRLFKKRLQNEKNSADHYKTVLIVITGFLVATHKPSNGGARVSILNKGPGADRANSLRHPRSTSKRKASMVDPSISMWRPTMPG